MIYFFLLFIIDISKFNLWGVLIGVLFNAFKLGLFDYSEVTTLVIRHISPLMFDVIYDKPEGFIMNKHEPVGRGFIQYHINHGRRAGLCLINPRSILH